MCRLHQKYRVKPETRHPAPEEILNYYLRIVKLVYFDAPESEREITGTSDTRIVLMVNVLLIIVILPWVGTLIGLCNQVIESLGYSLNY